MGQSSMTWNNGYGDISSSMSGAEPLRLLAQLALFNPAVFHISFGRMSSRLTSPFIGVTGQWIHLGFRDWLCEGKPIGANSMGLCSPHRI